MKRAVSVKSSAFQWVSGTRPAGCPDLSAPSWGSYSPHWACGAPAQAHHSSGQRKWSIESFFLMCRPFSLFVGPSLCTLGSPEKGARSQERDLRSTVRDSPRWSWWFPHSSPWLWRGLPQWWQRRYCYRKSLSACWNHLRSHWGGAHSQGCSGHHPRWPECPPAENLHLHRPRHSLDPPSVHHVGTSA